jgi:mannosyltransferase OCH1-like enzyme
MKGPTMIPKILHWTTRANTWEERRLIGEAKRLMPGWRHKVWSDEENLGLVKRLLPDHVEQYLGFEHGVVRTDIARCLYLHQHGGVYADTDYRFYRALDAAFLKNTCVLGIEAERIKSFPGAKYGNAFMASEPGFPMWLDFVEQAFARARAGEDRIVYIAGPHALSQYVNGSEAYRAAVTVMSRDTIYPAFDRLKLRGIRQPGTIGVHLCWGSWRNKALLLGMKNLARRKLSAWV